MIKNIIIGSGVAVIVVLGVISLKTPSVVTNTVYKDAPIGATQSSPVVNVPAPVVNVAAPKVSVNVPEQKLGALSSPDLPYNYLAFGGVRSWSASTDSLTQGSTTVCALQSPAATSTLVFGSVYFTLASSTAQIVDIAKATTPYATTTKLGTTATIGAGNQAAIVASTSASIVGDAYTFAPNNYMVVKIAGTVVGGTGNVPTGSCKAEWKQLI